MKPRGAASRLQSTERESLRPPPPSTPQFGRDSDASLCSSRPSSSSFGLTTTTNSRHHTDKQSMVRSINAYLSSHNISLSLSFKPLPSAKVVTDILRFLLSRFGFSGNSSGIKGNNNSTLDDDLFLLLKYLNCPHKINKSALRAPAAPHAFPQMLAVIYWLVQLADYLDHLHSEDKTDRFSFMKDALMVYAVDSYLPYMSGDDEAVELLDREFSEKMEREKASLEANLKSLDDEGKLLESELEKLKTKPSEREMYESRFKDLERDLQKFQGYVDSLQDSNSITQKSLEEKGKELAAKVEEIRRTQEENEELKKRVEAQGMNMRDAERMKRELQAVEREISEAEASRSSWEEKSWDLDALIGQKLKELENLSVECNQALRRLKLQGDFQYLLDAKGSTPAEVLGINYKSTLKPAISLLADEIKQSTTAKLEEFIALQEQSKELTTRIEAKRNRLKALQLHIDESEQQFEVTRNQIEEYTSWCTNEAQRIRAEMEEEAHNIDNMEKEAADTLRDAELKLQEEIRLSEQETQLCAYELFAMIDLVSRCKEYTEKKISDMKRDLLENVESISNAYKNTLLPRLQ
ncbi:kinetochore protein NDC80 homolog [Beta vulgaris subsp. vulgaris]|uniref:kinetochore protein NDC80 homolog n=1 Tax=Beta vulgaris subsp. vulgaris TaxID=3555 RepID=UPI0020375D1D|nr:kinetochore protein NDC80 homolog [Beta vulgaris subsp. vulgaris]